MTFTGFLFMLLQSIPPQGAALSHAPAWTSLEIAKLIVSGLTPLAVVVAGFWINRQLKRFEHLQWTRQKGVEKRLRVYEEIVPHLNDLLCYFTFVGCWKELTPPEVVGLKRQLDRVMHVNAPLFPDVVMQNYNAFMRLCYETYTGWGKDARIRSSFHRRKEAAGEKWTSVWDQHFVTSADQDEAELVRAAYTRLVTSLASEIGVGLQQPHVPTGRVPSHIR
jgi:hypothetical protein